MTVGLTLKLDEQGFGTVELDGKPIPELTGADIKIRAGELTEVTLHVHAGISADIRTTLESIGVKVPEAKPPLSYDDVVWTK